MPLLPIAAVLAVTVAALAQSSTDILVRTENFVRRHSASGEMLTQIAVPWPNGPRPITESVRDVVLHASGDLYVFNGTFTPYLSVLRQSTGLWQHWSHPAWSTTNGGSNGGVAVRGDFVFVTGETNVFAPGVLLRFDTVTSTFTVFGTGTPYGYDEVTVGWDGLLYALSATEQDVAVFDPDSLQLLRTIALPHATMARGLGVLPDGTLLVATWNDGFRRFDGNGMLQATLPTPGLRLHDLEMDACGNVMCGERFGFLLRTNATLDAYSTTVVGSFDVMVAFADPTVPAPASAAVRAGAPANPVAFHGGGALLGSTWQGWLTPFVPGALFDVVAFGAGAANVPSPAGTILFDELATWFLLDATAGEPVQVGIPNDCRLHGYTFVAQAASVSLDGFALANALDVRISSFVD